MDGELAPAGSSADSAQVPKRPLDQDGKLPGQGPSKRPANESNRGPDQGQPKRLQQQSRKSGQASHPKKPVLEAPPYSRRLSFRRQIYKSELEEFVCNRLSRHAGTSTLRVVLGRVVSRDTQRDVVLPINSQAILADDFKDHVFDPCLSEEACEAVRSELQAQREGWQRNDPAVGRWSEISYSQCRRAPPGLPREVCTVYCPEGGWHYQLQVGQKPECDANSSSLGQKIIEEQHEKAYLLRKDKSADAPWWRAAVCELRRDGDAAADAASAAGAEAAEGPVKRFVQLEMNTRFLWQQRQRMSEKKPHRYNLLVSALLRNATALANVLSRIPKEPVEYGKIMPYYPGLFSGLDAVRQFYTDKAQTVRELQRLGRTDQDIEATANVRRYNNLVKVLLIEQAIDNLPFDKPCLLDLGCGHGQDISKYSRKFRKVELVKYVGVDFASMAVDEAKRRHAEQSKKFPTSAYPAHFYVDDVRSDSLFQRLKADGHSTFHAVTSMFMLQYIADSRDSVVNLLKKIRALMPLDGRLLCCIPCCETLADLCGSSSSGEEGVGNSLYRIRFDGEFKNPDESELFHEEWGHSYTFSMLGSVDAQREYVVPMEDFEEVLQETNFEVFLEGSFPELLSMYCPGSRYWCDWFSQDHRTTELTADEEDLLGLYRGLVLKAVEPPGGGET